MAVSYVQFWLAGFELMLVLRHKLFALVVNYACVMKAMKYVCAVLVQ